VATDHGQHHPAAHHGSLYRNNKIYDGECSATVLTHSLTGAISGDAVSLDGRYGAFGDKTVANGKTVTLTGASLTGADAGNSFWITVATTTPTSHRCTLTGSLYATQDL